VRAARRLGVATALWLAACLLAGCGQSSDHAARPADAGAGAVPGAKAEVVLRRGSGPEPATLDPQRAEDESSRDIIRDLFEGLVAETRKGEFEPGAAEAWTVSPDGLSWTFRLRADGRWSNGDAVTAADFVAGLRRAVDPATASTTATLLLPLAGAAAIIAGEQPAETLGAEAVDALTLVLRLQAPTPYLLGLLTHPATFPVHGPSLAEHGARFARPGRLVSNGPYALDSWETHSHVQLVRNLHYRERARIGVVRFYALDAPEAALNRYRAGDLDYTTQFPLARFQWLRENLPEELKLSPGLSNQFWLFNTVRPPLDDLRVRKALAMTVDRELLTRVVTGLADHPAYGLVPPGVANYTAQTFEWAGLPMAERVEQARALLAEAGYGPSRPLRVEVHYNTDENLRRVAVAVASMWREHLGVETTLYNEEFRVMLERRKDPEQWQILRLSWRGDYNDAANFLEILSVGGTVNNTGFDDPEYERLLAAAAVEPDPARRRAHLEEAERRMLAFHPILPLYHPTGKHLVKPWVRGFDTGVLNRVYSRHLEIDVEMRGF
jgi:oligopeptide transport system substrate-binding protein